MIKILVSDSNGESLNGVTLTVVISTSNIVKLNMKPLDKFNNAAGPITVVYSGGYLMGEGGPVEPFEETFTPTDLIMKPNQMVRERLELSSLDINSKLKDINYIDNIVRENLVISNLLIITELIPIDEI